MVFVEYESEVDEEMARVRTLLDKLRIDAEIRVFWLACGQLDTYERIINGTSSNMDCEIVVNDALKDEEWWNDLEDFRGKSEPMTTSQDLNHLAHVITSTAGRPGVYNPHEELESRRRRRSSVMGVPSIPKKPHIGSLSKMGISLGMHTHHLNEDVLEESESDSEYDSNSDSELGDVEGSVAESLLPEMTSLRVPFSAAAARGNGASSSTPDYSTNGNYPITPAYGTMSRSQTLLQGHPTPASQLIPEVDLDATPRPANRRQRSSGLKLDIKSIESFPNLEQLAASDAHRSVPQSSSSTKAPGDRYSGDDDAPTPRRGLSRQSSAARFSSRPVPEMRITIEEGNSRIGFAATTNSSSPATPKTDRPSFSRQSSLGKYPITQPLMDAKRSTMGAGVRAISYTEPPTHYSRTNTSTQSRFYSHSRSEFIQGHVSLNIPELVQSYRFDAEAGPGEGAPYSTQGIALSFNDLPSRAQHLILNELMRQNAKDTAVLLSTLPIPIEGTYLSDEGTIQYLSDVELLCHDLPPALLVLSNNMTVTVSL